MSNDGKRLYVVGGDDGGQSFNTAEYYSFEGKKWVRIAKEMNVRRSCCGVAMSPDGLTLFVVGGKSHGTTCLDTVECYDIENDVWVNMIGRLNVPRYMLGVVVSGNKLYAVGGWNRKSLSSVEVLELESGDLPLLSDRDSGLINLLPFFSRHSSWPL